MNNMVTLDANYSTTKVVFREKPIIKTRSKDIFETVLFRHNKIEEEGGLRTKGYFKKSFSNKPLVSVITVVYNGEKYLEDTIISVINQTYDNVEYLIIDGGSTDGTLDIIKKYEDKIDYWISEVDDGIYDAMNKGIGFTTGKLIGMINADDWYSSFTLKIVVNNYLKNKNKNNIVLCGNMYKLHSDYNEKIQVKSSFDDLESYNTVCHPTCFVEQDIYKMKIYDSNYQISGDYEFFLELYTNKKKYALKFIHIDEYLAYMREGGASSKFKIKSILESFDARYRHTSPKNSLYYLVFELMIDFPKAYFYPFLKENNMHYIIEINKKLKKFFSKDSDV